MITIITLLRKSSFLFLLFLLHTTSWADVHLYPQAEPERGAGFTDDYKVLLEDPNKSVSNFIELSQLHSQSVVALSPWVDSYWPNYRGGIASRFSDPSIPSTKNWSQHYNFYLQNPSSSYIQSNRTDQLSPAEKYDLLVGDSNWTLTKYVWGIGIGYQNAFGVVPTWTGICHGWAAATQIGLPSPTQSVTMMDVTQQNSIRFFPFDVSALTSYLWSRPSVKDHFTGRRCRTSNPSSASGRITDGPCFDVNPMTWHLGVMNRVGISKKSLVMDTSYSTEVWNYAIDQYRTLYFNPASIEYSYNAKDSIISVSDFPHDPLKAYRSEKAKYLVGVMMDVFHPGAVNPHKGYRPRSYLEKKRFVYDLELDDQFEVVGGEWHSLTHPDFLWLYSEDYNPYLSENQENPLYTASLNPLITPELAARARKYSAKGKVMDEVVYKILTKSITSAP